MRIYRGQLEQMIATSDPLLRTAIRKLVADNHAYVVAGVPEDLLDEMIDRGIKKARDYGLSSPRAIATFVLLMFEFGPEFHRHPAIQARLGDASVAPDERLEAVINDTPPEVWEQIQAALHRQTWFPELRQRDAD